MASYGLSRDDLAQMIAEEFHRMVSAPENSGVKPRDEVLPIMFTGLIDSVALVLEENNAKLAEQIIAELRGGGTPAGRG